MSTLATLALIFLCGWILRGAVGSAWRSTRRPHRFSDARHKWVQIDGAAHAFTDGELAEACDRARRLTPGRVLWRNRLLWAVAVAVLLVLAVAGCGKKEIPTSRSAPPLKGWIAAEGKSMLPTFPEKSLVEFEVVPFEALKAGDSVIFWDYTRDAAKPHLIHHRLKTRQLGNWIAQGDNPDTNPVADRPWVTPDNYLARTTGRHTQFLFVGSP